MEPQREFLFKPTATKVPARNPAVLIFLVNSSDWFRDYRLATGLVAVPVQNLR